MKNSFFTLHIKYTFSLKNFFSSKKSYHFLKYWIVFKKMLLNGYRCCGINKLWLLTMVFFTNLNTTQNYCRFIPILTYFIELYTFNFFLTTSSSNNKVSLSVQVYTIEINELQNLAKYGRPAHIITIIDIRQNNKTDDTFSISLF